MYLLPTATAALQHQAIVHQAIAITTLLQPLRAILQVPAVPPIAPLSLIKRNHTVNYVLFVEEIQGTGKRGVKDQESSMRRLITQVRSAQDEETAENAM
jgi:hypothetical protein